MKGVMIVTRYNINKIKSLRKLIFYLILNLTNSYIHGNFQEARNKYLNLDTLVNEFNIRDLKDDIFL